MSWVNVRPYFNSILEAKGYQEWPDAFATDNIPANVIDKSFHVQPGPFTGIRQNQLDQETECAVTIKTFYKGYRTPQLAFDEAILDTESIMKDCVKVSEIGGRVNTVGILNVVFNEANIDPVDGSNDNELVVTSQYTVRIMVGANE